MKHIFITGEIGIGKSTLISKLLSLYTGKMTFGFYTKKESMADDGISRVYIHAANDSHRSYTKSNCIAACSVQGGTADISVFETTGLSMIVNIPPGSLVVMDELGVFETTAQEFCSEVLSILNSDNVVIGAVRLADSPFLQAVKTHPKVALYHMTQHNRDQLFKTIVKEMEGCYKNEKIV